VSFVEFIRAGGSELKDLDIPQLEAMVLNDGDDVSHMMMLHRVGLDEEQGAIGHLGVIDGLDVIQSGYFDGDVAIEHGAHFDLVFEDVSPDFAHFIGFELLGSVLLQHVLIEFIAVGIDPGDHQFVRVRAEVIFFETDIEHCVSELEQVVEIDLQIVEVYHL
jgi:hypothetical protein